MAGERALAPVGEHGEHHADVALVDVVRIERTAVPFEHPPILLVGGIEHGFEEIHEATGATDVLGWPPAGAVDEGRVVDVGRAVAEWTDGAEVVDLGAKFTSPVVVPAEGGAEVVVRGSVKSVEDGLATLALEVTCGGQKVLGMPKAVVRA